MKVLVACEESQRVTKAFRDKGHEAYSCDIIPCSGGHPEWHIQCDVREVLNEKWDLMIAHPPCTYLSVVAARHLYRGGELNQKRYEKGVIAAKFFSLLLNANISKICVENPVQFKVFKLPKYDQIIHPYYFGEPYQKRTCLWLKGLPKLTWDKSKAIKPIPMYHLNTNGKPINWVEGIRGEGERAKARSKTFQSIAQAMEEQWG